MQNKKQEDELELEAIRVACVGTNEELGYRPITDKELEQINRKGEKMKTKTKTQISVNMDTKLLNKLDEYATNMSISRSGAIAILVTIGINQDILINQLPELIKAANKC